jgi:hypothetical protein
VAEVVPLANGKDQNAVEYGRRQAALPDGAERRRGPETEFAGRKAYWRGFILENRTTRAVHALFRFKYKNGNRNWFSMQPKQKGDRETTMHALRCSLEDNIKLAMKVFGIPPEVAAQAIECFYPPDDEGDPGKTVIWLEQRNLIEIHVQPEEAEDDRKSNL